jgi:hypothetical protein
MGLVMVLACRQPLPLYRPRDPQASDWPAQNLVLQANLNVVVLVFLFRSVV